ncbi:MAG TPA: hypothetical protein EYQ21_01140 [Flavobacteriales bacterium]|jgi:hypothetical protein|nr:hypothetical protein [Flavobacteriales bacterium]
MTDLITKDEYKEYKNLSQSVKEDGRIDALVDSVSQLVKTYCGNSIVDYYSANKTETFNVNWGTYVVQLTESPVNTIVSVQEREGYSSDYTTLTSGAQQYYLDTDTDSILRTTSGSEYTNWPLGPAAVKIVYTAGYATPPKDLQLAVADLITYYLKDEYKERRSLQGASVQNRGTSSMSDNVDFPDHIKRVLDLYKNF